MPHLPKDTESDQVLAALEQFDRELRPTAQWTNWDRKAAQRFAIAHDNGKRYPPKKIISLATGAGVHTFSGGTEANNWLHARGFTIVDLKAGDG